MRQAADPVLLALHYQNENCHPDGKIKFGIADGDAGRDAVLAAAKRLLQGARAHKAPIVHVRLAVRPDHRDVLANCRIFKSFIETGAFAEGSWGAAFHEGLEPAAGELVVTHGRNNAFYASQLDEYLNRLASRRLIVAGVSTTYVVESTVRHAVDAGYRVVVAHDACSTHSREAHEASLRAMRLLGDIRSVDEVIAALANEIERDRLFATP